MGAVRVVGEGIPEHMKDMFERAVAVSGKTRQCLLNRDRVGHHLLLRGRRKTSLKCLQSPVCC